jgi:hypothetical protein
MGTSCVWCLDHKESKNTTRYVVDAEGNDFLCKLVLNSLSALLARGDISVANLEVVGSVGDLLMVWPAVVHGVT